MPCYAGYTERISQIEKLWRRMDNKEKLAELQKFPLPDNADFFLKEVLNVNFRPHPYTIGSSHLNKNDSMYLGEEQIRYMEKHKGVHCAHPHCRVPYDEHTSDLVCIVGVYGDLELQKVPNLQSYLQSLVAKSEELKIAGFAFVKEKR